MIFGIGTDIVELARIANDIEKFGDRFAAKILTEKEMEDYRVSKNQTAFLAKRFAAKEAVSKAMGTGIRNGALLTQIEVDHDDSGKPVLRFHKTAEEFINENKIDSTHISISDERHHAIAFATLEQL